ncbi:MAG TPA: hypothetical protein VHY37_06255 [Tepidisphaeraceae bacterium]|nr:hypothetical protein [Tepidisphaeraceae bacterium]
MHDWHGAHRLSLGSRLGAMHHHAAFAEADIGDSQPKGLRGRPQPGVAGQGEHQSPFGIRACGNNRFNGVDGDILSAVGIGLRSGLHLAERVVRQLAAVNGVLEELPGLLDPSGNRRLRQTLLYQTSPPVIGSGKRDDFHIRLCAEKLAQRPHGNAKIRHRPRLQRGLALADNAADVLAHKRRLVRLAVCHQSRLGEFGIERVADVGQPVTGCLGNRLSRFLLVHQSPDVFADFIGGGAADVGKIDRLAPTRWPELDHASAVFVGERCHISFAFPAKCVRFHRGGNAPLFRRDPAPGCQPSPTSEASCPSRR